MEDQIKKHYSSNIIIIIYKMFKIVKKGNFMYYVYDDEKLIKIFHNEQKALKYVKEQELLLEMHYLYETVYQNILINCLFQLIKLFFTTKVFYLQNIQMNFLYFYLYYDVVYIIYVFHLQM